MDFVILESARHYIKSLKLSEAKNAFFVTEDKELARYAESLGINILDYEGLQQRLENVSVTSQAVADEGANISRVNKRADIKWFVSGVSSGVIGSLIASLAAAKIMAVVATINIWGTIIALPFLGIFLFLVQI